MTLAHDVTGSGPPIVLLHEGVADRRMWRHQLPVLEPEHTVVTLDLRGFGDSPHASGTFSNVEDVRELLDELGIDQAAVVGGSFGARVALELALVHPRRVSRLVLCPPALSDWEWSQTVRDAWRAEGEAYEAGDLDRATEVNVELWVDGQIAKSGGPPSLGGDVLRELSWDLGELRGKWGTLVLVDDATAGDGHLDVDDVWLWD